MIRVFRALPILAALAGAGMAGYWLARHPLLAPSSVVAPAATGQATAEPSAERKVLYYRDPTGAPYWSAEPKRSADGRDWLAVYDDEDVSFEPPGEKKLTVAGGSRRILYYRNPMGLPDTSPVPKKDWMGMDYIPVYEGEETDNGKTVKVSLDKIQRSGVRTETAEPRVIVRPVRAVGTVRVDERRLTSVALRSDGYIEELFVNTTGQHVEAGEPLFRVYSPQIQQVQIDLMVAVRALQRGGPGLDGNRSLEGPMLRLRNLGVPESRIREVRATGANPRTIDWPAPASGTVMEKRVINGQRVVAGEELYRIADLSQVWVIADVSESDLAEIKLGSRAAVTFRAYPTQPVQGEVTFIYPDLKPETRTVRVRIELPNPDGRLKPDMYADVVFHSGIDGAPVVTVAVSAVIDSGVRQVVLVAKGDGRFEPRAVKLGRRGNGHVEVLEGLTSGEEVVTSATFLIDAESNLKAALQAFSHPEEAPK